MGDRLTSEPSKDVNGASLPDWMKVGVDISGIVGYQLDTAISDGDGPVHGFSADVEYAETSKDTYQLYMQMLWGESSGKTLPTGGEDIPTSHRSILLGLGNEHELESHFGKEGNRAISLTMESQQLIGWGETERSNAYTGEGTGGEGTLDMSSSVFLNAKVGLGKQFELNIAPGFLYGVEYDGEASDYNRLRLALMMYASLGWGATNITGANEADVKVGPAADVTEFYKIAHAALMRGLINSTLSDQQQAVEEYGLDAGGESGGPLAIVPTFMAASALISGLTDSLGTPLHSDLFWAFTGAYAVEGMAFTAMEGDAGRIGGISDLLKAARLSTYAMAGIESVEGRGRHSDEENELLEEYANLGSFLFNSGFLAVGQGLDSDVVETGAADANIRVAYNPGQATDMVEDLYIFPGWAALSDRAALTFHNSWRHLPLASGVTARYGGDEKNIDLDSYLAAQWDSQYHDLFIGLNNNITFGKDPGASLGLAAGAALKIADRVIIDVRALYNPWNPEDPIDVLLNGTIHF